MGDRLIDQRWEDVTYDHVIGSFLRAEATEDNFTSRGAYKPTSEEMRVIDDQDFGNVSDNERRKWLLFSPLGRWGIFKEVPESTRWSNVSFLKAAHLPELWVIPVKGYQQLNSRRPEPLRELPENWDEPILWGHTKAGPFTILEGNHRLMAYAGLQKPDRPPLRIPVFIGLSDEKCFWHLPDYYDIRS